VRAVPVIRAATADDLDAVLELLQERDRAVFGDVATQRRWVEHDLAQAAYDCLVAHDDGRVVGWATLDGARDLTVAATAEPIAEELLAQVEASARRRRFDSLTSIAVPEDAVLWPLLERSGFTHSREILRMWRTLDGELPVPGWPACVTVRPYTGEDGRRVHALLDAVYAGWDPDYAELTHDDWLAFMTDHEEFDPELWFLVERDGVLVACALHWRESDGKGWVKDIVVHENERGRGLGRALLEHGFREYRARGVERVGLKVDANNPTGAIRLYERVGFAVDRRYVVWEKAL
jgi:ribosomal protein S18 acetylase RimI-like enzyme